MEGHARGVAAGLIFFVGYLFILGLFTTNEPKCSLSGCNKDAKDGSRYCILHDMSYRSYGNPDYNEVYKNSQKKLEMDRQKKTSNSSTPSSKVNSSSTRSGKTSSSTKKYSAHSSYEDSYDDGYNDVYEDGDYDWDRYDKDDDYATGVDDAMDECEEDW